MFERFAASARSAVHLAIGEAGRRGDRRVGTEHLLVGVLHDPRIAVVLGADAEAGRRVADELDHRALTGIGLDPSEFGTAEAATDVSHLPFTPGAKAVLTRTLVMARMERARRIESRHLLLALLERAEPDPVAGMLVELGVDPGQVRGRLVA